MVLSYSTDMSQNMANGALQVSTKGAGGTNQLSKGWIEAVVDNLSDTDIVKLKVRAALKNNMSIKTIIVAVDKSDKTVKIIPVKIPNQ
ncbi:hypothetical protein [Pelistega suis]|uniref:hypothetical protein n=1 Tax=Pelistega suis TaxID=1631957 RepID=UPI00211BDC3F|nr:hypothetical protein [Pelistega suis]MCQ9329371.1 hypothetical protein [Pelistega suis]